MSTITSTISPSSQYMDLLKAQKALRDKYGYDAPSYATLRRWVAEGKLISALRASENGKGRALYSVLEIERICLGTGRAKKFKLSQQDQLALNAGQNGGGEDASAQHSSIALDAPSMLGEINSRLELLFDSVAALLARSSEQDALIRICINGITRLDAVRTNLMLKYDATATAQHEVIEQLRARVKEQEKISDFERITLKIGAQLSHLSEKVSSLQSAVATPPVVGSRNM